MEKHILILTDFVGYGAVAMATARAVLTRMGHRVYCLPTALISNTWNFGSAVQLDTTDYLKEALAAWQKLGFPLDGVLLGYVADDRQADWLAEQCSRWQQAGVQIVFDPIFADDGKLYRGITPSRLEFLKDLLPLVDYALPNWTEAGFLTGAQDPLTALRALTDLGRNNALITGVPWQGEAAVLLGDGKGERILPYRPIPGRFPGAGDAFTALFTGHLLSGRPAEESARAAIDTTRSWITQSIRENWQGMGLPVERCF